MIPEAVFEKSFPLSAPSAAASICISAIGAPPGADFMADLAIKQALKSAIEVLAEGTAPAIPSVFAQRVQWLFLDGFYAYLSALTGGSVAQARAPGTLHA